MKEFKGQWCNCKTENLVPLLTEAFDCSLLRVTWPLHSKLSLNKLRKRGVPENQM